MSKMSTNYATCTTGMPTLCSADMELTFLASKAATLSYDRFVAKHGEALLMASIVGDFTDDEKRVTFWYGEYEYYASLSLPTLRCIVSTS